MWIIRSSLITLTLLIQIQCFPNFRSIHQDLSQLRPVCCCGSYVSTSIWTKQCVAYTLKPVTSYLAVSLGKLCTCAFFINLNATFLTTELVLLKRIKFLYASSFNAPNLSTFHQGPFHPLVPCHTHPV